MRSRLASLVVALLMTVALTTPAEAKGMPGIIQSVSVVVASDNFPTCSFTISADINKVRKAGYSTTVAVWSGGIHREAPDGMESFVSVPQYATSIPTQTLTGTHFTNGVSNYNVIVSMWKPGHGQDTQIDQVGTTDFTISGSSCGTVGTEVSTYTQP